MGFILTLLLIVALCGVVVYLDRQSSPTRREQLLNELHDTDRKVEGEYRRARRAMNDAAGQSWRNPFE